VNENGNAKPPVTPFSRALGGGTLRDKFVHRGSGKKKLDEFDDTHRFFTTACDPFMGHSQDFFYTFHHKKDTKDRF
jgi:hypothetical protein